jgi:uncharacterized membrane protein
MPVRSFFIIYGLLVLTACNNGEKNKDTPAGDTINNITRPPLPALPDTVFAGFGTEPFWAVYVVADAEIVFHPADGDDVKVPWVAATMPDVNTLEYESSAGDKSIQLTIIKKECSDGMSDDTFPTTVNLVVNGRGYHGCGRK